MKVDAVSAADDIAVSSLAATVNRLSPWFHNLHLPDGTQTAPDHPYGDFPAFKWNAIKEHIPEDLTGWKALDIGCNAGFYTFELARRGAKVTAIDMDEHYLNQARWAAAQMNLENNVTFRCMQVYDLARLNEQFDLVFFMGVFYHLRYPLLALDIVAQKVQRLLVFQTLSMPGKEIYEKTYEDPASAAQDLGINNRAVLCEPGWPKMAFIEHRLAHDPTNWWLPNHAAIEAMLRSSGLKILGHPTDETYLCAPDPEKPSCVTTWNAGELRSATGRTKP